MSDNKHRREKIIGIRQEIGCSKLDPDRKVLVQEFLTGADRCLDATTVETKLDAVVNGQSDIISYLAREAVRSERMVDKKIEMCKNANKCNLNWPAFWTVVTILGTVVGIVFRLIR